MSFVCPECLRPGSLAITHRLELPPDGRSDEIMLQIVACGACGFAGTAVYEESRRGASDSWHHDGYYVSAANLASLQNIMRQCPKPRDKRCRCTAHRALRRTKQGIWQLPDGMAGQKRFPLRRGRR